jgi:acetyl esterase/lipase/GH43 family beta-xylosidase
MHKTRPTRLAITTLCLLSCLGTTHADEPDRYDEAVPKPTFSEVSYGPHKRLKLDFWKAESDNPTPLVLIIHGGGWQGGSKERANLFVDVKTLLDAGISVAANNYRLMSHAKGVTPPVKAPMHDCARALQFLRSKAAEWNIDSARVGLAGASAGACTSLWLAYHDDLADPASNDPVARQSSKPQHVAVRGAQTTLDPEQMKQWTPNSLYGGHAFGKEDFETFLAERESILPWINEYSPYALVRKDAPPVVIFYDGPPAMGKEQEDPTHTANFGVGLQQRCRELGVECTIFYPGEPASYTGFTTKHSTDYLIGKLANPGKSAASPAGEYPLSLAEIRVRDPFILADQESKTYYLYAQGGNRALNDDADLGVEVYRSRDLLRWSAPKTVFKRPKKGFWGNQSIWAPEVHEFDGVYYMFASIGGRAGGRGTQILRAASPEGPFVIVGQHANTPPEQYALDGTPWIDDDGSHWMVYAHGWNQIKDGAMLALRMSKDWSSRIGEPITLFHGSQGPWVHAYPKDDTYVNEGAFLHRMKNGTLVMIWSSFVSANGKKGYAIGQAVSESGTVAGPWQHAETPLFGGQAEDGGHAMILRDFSGDLLLVFHQPNIDPDDLKLERAQIFRVKESGNKLVMDGRWKAKPDAKSGN